MLSSPLDWMRRSKISLRGPDSRGDRDLDEAIFTTPDGTSATTRTHQGYP
jgi:hypothetical protein